MTDATDATGALKPRFRGSHVLTILVCFFGTIFAVDGFMVYRAVSTFGGVETPDAYRKGVAYNESIALEEAQTRRGWSDETKVIGPPQRVQVSLRDKGGAAVAGKRVVAVVGRPATDRYDMTLTLHELAPGLYEAALPGAGEGTWLVDISAYDSDSSGEPVYQARRRAWIKP
jgi:nitrogen fixation protein FixH